MPVYLFTYHGYRTWNADNPRGFVQEGEGIQPPNQQLARSNDRFAQQLPVVFDPVMQEVLVWIAHDACVRRGWRPHFFATESTHVHLLTSWSSIDSWPEVRRKLKTLMSLKLGEKLRCPGRKWFSRKASRKQVKDRQHFDYLMSKYLPRHSGLCWKEGDAPPIEPKGRA
jgi:hypothetical protein